MRELSPEDLVRFRDWFYAFDARVWDRAFEADVEMGRLDHLADEAIRARRAGESRPI